LNFRPVNTGIELLKILFQLFPDKIKERLYKTLANPSGTGHLDKLMGVEKSFEKMKSGVDFHTDVSAFWMPAIASSLLYH